MTLLLALGLGSAALVIVVVAPVLLTAGRWQVHRPRLALLAWQVAIVLGLGTALATVSVTAAAAIDGASRAAGEQVALWLLAWLLLFATASVVAAVAATAESWGRDEAHGFPYVMGMQQQVRIGRRDVYVVPSQEPFASSLAGRDGFVMVSQGLVDLVSPKELEAVVEHEVVHLRERHHLLRELACLQAASLPWLPAARRFERASRLLIELVADEEAARSVGRVHVANALLRMSWASGAASLDLRAELLAARAQGSRRRRVRRSRPAHAA